MINSRYSFAQINAFSMQNGLILGLWTLLALLAMLLSFTYSMLSLVSAIMLIFAPILLFLLTKKIS